MSKDLFQNLLVDVFEEDASNDRYFDSLEDPFLRGWSFTCDLRGRYTECSPEVNRLLRIPASKFIDNSFINFHLSPASATEMQFTLKKEKPPYKIEVVFERPDGKCVPAVMNLFAAIDREGKHVGWHGFAYLTEAPHENEALVDRAAEKRTEEKTGPRIKRTVEMADSILPGLLEEVRLQSSTLQKERRSSVIREDHTTNHSADGTGEVHLRYKIEWGYKLGLTAKEKAFINKHPVVEKRNLFRRIFSPRSILQCDKCWISVVLSVENKEAFIWVDYPDAKGRTKRLKVEEFLVDTQPLLDEIQRGFSSPWYVNTKLQRGRDYLVAD